LRRSCPALHWWRIKPPCPSGIISTTPTFWHRSPLLTYFITSIVHTVFQLPQSFSARIMPVLSTLRILSEEEMSTISSLWIPLCHNAQNHGIEDYDPHPVANTLLMPPSALADVDFVPLRLAHSPDTEHTYIGENDYGAPQRHHAIEPVDGETVWFCSACNDGPYGAWQSSCQICQHTKCSSCRVEKKK
jgi:hypothetical protein